MTGTPGRYELGGTPEVSTQQLDNKPDNKPDLVIDQISKLTEGLTDFRTAVQKGFLELKVITSHQDATAERQAVTIERPSLTLERLALMLERVLAKEG
jgi:hypothetical protein